MMSTKSSSVSPPRPPHKSAGANTRTSWLNLLRPRRPNAPAQYGPGAEPKLTTDMADLLIMSALDTKAPPETVGSDHLLDELVQNHLERQPAAPVPAGGTVDQMAIRPDLTREE